mgnify:CR=1 FL=1
MISNQTALHFRIVGQNGCFFVQISQISKITVVFLFRFRKSQRFTKSHPPILEYTDHQIHRMNSVPMHITFLTPHNIDKNTELFQCLYKN